MKHVFNSSEVPHIWALQQQKDGRNQQSNFYFTNGTIFSYGSHFPIATINGNDVFLTLRKYSVTTSQHVYAAHRAVSHKNIIYCYDVPVPYNNETIASDHKKGYLNTTHTNNLIRWRDEIKAVFNELGNKRIKDVQSRVNSINTHIERLTAYCNYFKLKIKDKELNDLLKLAKSDNFIESARIAKEKQNEAIAKKIKVATKAFNQYIDLWRNFKDEEITALPDQIKNLVYYYKNNAESYTRLRYNAAQNRLETSKGVQIPAEVAKRAFIQINGCMEGNCKDINVPVMNYTITETTKDYIKAGCHTIPKTDINYIAELLNWK